MIKYSINNNDFKFDTVEDAENELFKSKKYNVGKVISIYHIDLSNLSFPLKTNKTEFLIISEVDAKNSNSCLVS